MSKVLGFSIKDIECGTKHHCKRKIYRIIVEIKV